MVPMESLSTILQVNDQVSGIALRLDLLVDLLEAAGVGVGEVATPTTTVEVVPKVRDEVAEMTALSRHASRSWKAMKKRLSDSSRHDS